MASIGLTLRDAFMTQLAAATSLNKVVKGPVGTPAVVDGWPWAEVILGNAPVSRMMYGPLRFDRELSVIIHAKTEETCMLALEQVNAAFEGSSTYWQTLKATVLGAGEELLDVAPVEGAGSYEYDNVNGEHIGIAEFILSYRKAT